MGSGGAARAAAAGRGSRAYNEFRDEDDLSGGDEERGDRLPKPAHYGYSAEQDLREKDLHAIVVEEVEDMEKV